jgi:biofilm PGA synthesis N-glycosyltransferase PgaC
MEFGWKIRPYDRRIVLESRTHPLDVWLVENTTRAGDSDGELGGRPGLQCSVGIMAYNEEANIADAVDSVLAQRLTSGRLTEVIVVASGCEDQTAEIVLGIARRDPRVRLIEQERREGKASAINLFIAAAQSPVLVLVGADLVVKDGTLDAMLSHFHDPAVGMVGGHPTPVNDEGTFLGHAVHLQWRLHDSVARVSPKLGEIVAFRNLVPSIPVDTAVDEISIQALVTQLGYRLVYEPAAIVYNRGPASVGDFLRQRRRIYAGHLRVREQQGYSAPTMNSWRVLRALGGAHAFSTPPAAVRTIGAVCLEAAARALGHYDVARRRSQHVWEVSATTKSHIADAANADGHQNVAVFHIVDFHRMQLEVGVHSARQVTRRTAEHIKRVLGAGASVSIQQGGTIIALLPGDREAAEGTAREIVRRFELAPSPANGRRSEPALTLACGIIAFPRVGAPLARSITQTRLEADTAVTVAG